MSLRSTGYRNDGWARGDPVPILNTHTGTYKGVPATGVRVTTAVCNIVTLDEQRRVIAEEAYYDDLQTMLKLEAVRPT